jgi:UDP-N-acetyl-2-amino-2-deoxyglucuronate dehydrogenase
MSETTKIRFAVIGCGHIGKRHAEMISRNPSAELVALVDIKAKEELGLEVYAGIPFFSTAEEFLATDIDCDVVNICTPNGLHARQAVAALKAKKHVVVEKPMALTKKDAEEIIFTSLRVHRNVFAVMQNRYSPPSVWLKELTESGKLGKIYLVQLRCYWNRDDRYYKPGNWHGSKELDGGVLFTQFSHFIDLMYWLVGDISNIHAHMQNNSHQHNTEFEDTGIVHFDFVNGGIGCISFTTSVWDKNMESSLTIVAENGTVKVGGQYMDKVEYCHVNDYALPELAPTNPGNDYGAYKGSAQNHHYVIDNVVDVLQGKASITTNALEGMKVVEIIEKIYKASAAFATLILPFL